MSWSIALNGKPDKIVEALKQHSEKLTGTCKDEFDGALPHLVGLLEQNYASTESGWTQPALLLDASGSGSLRSGVEVQRSCRVKIEYLPGTSV